MAVQYSFKDLILKGMGYKTNSWFNSCLIFIYDKRFLSLEYLYASL